MTETLVIRLGTAPAAAGDVLAEWAVVDGTGACTLAPAAGKLAGAAPLAQGRRTLVLVPAGSVLRTRVDVPVKGATKIAQALPFALEDLLAEDVEDLHFAAGARDTAGQVAVAVVRRDLMDRWQAELGAAGIEAQALQADSDGIPDISGTTTLILEQHQAMLRDPGGDPVVGELDALEDLLELWLAQPRPPAADGVVPARNLQVYDATIDGLPNERWERLQDRLDSLEVRRLPDGALLRLAAGIVTNPGVNLLQGDYGRRPGLGTYWPRWRLAAGLVGMLAILIVATAGAEAWRLKRESAALAEEIRQAASYTFPGVPPGNGLEAAVSARLQGVGVTPGNTGGQFLETLRSVAAAVAKTGSAKIESLNYRGGVMELQVRAPSADALDSIRKLVTETGRLKAEIQSSNADGDQIQGRIRITGNGA